MEKRTDIQNVVLGTMKELPKEERPYEKCLACGAASLSDAELLAVILRTGTKGQSALTLARQVLSASSASSGLLGIYHMSIPELRTIKGLGMVKAVQLKCIAELSCRIARSRASLELCFQNPSTIANYYMEQLRHEEQEVLLLLMLNSKNMLIQEEVISKGTVSASLISPREIFLIALKQQAVSVILLHNHPSGNPDPSKEDILFTRRVWEAGQLIGIELLDHIIIGDRQAVSLREQEAVPIWEKR